MDEDRRLKITTKPMAGVLKLYVGDPVLVVAQQI